MDDLIRKQTVLNMIDEVQFGNIAQKLSQLYEAVRNYPSVDAVEVVRCGECKYKPKGTGCNHDLEFPVHYKCPCECDDYWYSWMPKDDFFCRNGERKNDG